MGQMEGEKMIDAEKVIKGLNDIGDFIAGRIGIEQARNFLRTIDDAVALLKEQDAVKPILDKQTGRMWLCGKCGSYVGFEDNDPHDPNEYDKYCRDCGTPVLWEGR